MSSSANIETYLNSINTSKSNIKLALVEMGVTDPTDTFSLYPDKIDKCSSTTLIDITTAEGSTVTDVPVVEVCDTCRTSILPTSTNWSSVCYGNGKYVIVESKRSSKIAAYSTDGITWTQTAMPYSSRGTLWGSIAYGNGKFVSVTSGGSSNKYFSYSTDGITWTRTNSPTSGGSWYSVCYGNGKFVAIAYNSNISAYSEDGINWTASTMPSTAKWNSVCYGNGKFVAINYDNTNGSDISAYSTDGITWNQSTMPTSTKWRSVAYGNGKFVVVSFDSDISSAYSTDGITWTQTTLLKAYWQTVTYGNGKFVAISASSNILAYSEDGINWNQITLPTEISSSDITYGNNKFILVRISSSSQFVDYIDSHIGEVIRNDNRLTIDDSIIVDSIVGYKKDSLVNSFSVSGDYAVTLDNKAVCNLEKGTLYILMKGAATTSYENIYYNTSSVPSGVSLDSQSTYNNASTSTGKYYVAKYTGITGPVNISISMTTRNSTYDYYQADVTITYV